MKRVAKLSNTNTSPRRGRRTDEDRFFDAIKDGEMHTNKSVLEKLGWEKEKYERIRRQFIKDGKILPGQGHGGKVGLPKSKPEKLKVFISYAHEDAQIKTELENHMRPLVRRNLIEIWSDRQIAAGEEWEKEIFKEIEAADIILLLISVDFINSDFCYGRELERAMERHDADEARVIPVLLRNCVWKSTLFSKLQAVPKGAKPVKSWENHDDAFVSAVEEIEKAAEQLRGVKQGHKKPKSSA